MNEELIQIFISLRDSSIKRENGCLPNSTSMSCGFSKCKCCIYSTLYNPNTYNTHLINTMVTVNEQRTNTNS